MWIYLKNFTANVWSLSFLKNLLKKGLKIFIHTSQKMHKRVFNSTLAKDAINYINLRLKTMGIGDTTEGCDKLLKLEAALDELFTKEIEALISVDNPTPYDPTPPVDPVIDQAPVDQKSYEAAPSVDPVPTVDPTPGDCNPVSLERQASLSILDKIENAVDELLS